MTPFDLTPEQARTCVLYRHPRAYAAFFIRDGWRIRDAANHFFPLGDSRATEGEAWIDAIRQLWATEERAAMRRPVGRTTQQTKEAA